MIKKLILCLMLLNTVVIWTKFQSNASEITIKNTNLSYVIGEKLSQIKKAILHPLKQSEESVKLRLQRKAKYDKDPTMRLIDFFLRECN